MTHTWQHFRRLKRIRSIERITKALLLCIAIVIVLVLIAPAFAENWREMLKGG